MEIASKANQNYSGRGESKRLRKSRLSMSYRRATSVWFVLREGEFEIGGAGFFADEFFSLWQGLTHK
jgi:hypothetical protein